MGVMWPICISFAIMCIKAVMLPWCKTSFRNAKFCLHLTVKSWYLPMVPNGIGFLSSHILCRLLMAWPRQSGRTTVRDSCRKIEVTGTSTADPTYIECHTLSGICTVIINSENVFSIILTSMSMYDQQMLGRPN